MSARTPTRWLPLPLRPIALTATGAVTGVLIAPTPALAHGIAGKTDLPIPRWLFAWTAAVVLVVSFVALATMWPKPRLENAKSRVLLRIPRVLDPICGAIGVAVFAIVLYAGFAGEQELPTTNLAPTFIYVLFWVGLPILSLLFSDVFAAFNPWRATGRAVGWSLRRITGGRRPIDPRPYPRWLGRWPVAATIVGFAWLELIYVEHDKPSILALLAVLYATVQWVGMGVYGVETWSSRGDGFGVYFNLFSRLSPLHWHRDRLEVRPPLAGLVHLGQLPGTVAMLAAMIGSTSFDGLEQGSPWINTLEPELQGLFSNLGLGITPSTELAGTAGLLGMIAIIGGFYRLGIRGMHSIDPRTPTGVLAARFQHTLVPIALAYVIAHYWSLLIYQSQAMEYLISDPLGQGANLFGTAGGQIDFSVLTPNSIWYVQVGVLLLGHVCALALAHDRALVLYKDPGDAARSQYWMLVVMVVFTSLGLWLLSTAS